MSGRKQKTVYFFTSQGLWSVSNPESFYERVIKQDHFDYYNVTRSEFFSKKKNDCLFVRDIYLSWYAYGINKDINSQSELFNFLSDKAKRYDEVIVVGSSAGGYAAILFGASIKATRIVVFGPQNDLVGHLQFYCNSDQYQYFDVNSGRVKQNLSSLMESYDGKIYYFYAAKAKVDIFQYSGIKGIPSVVAFPMRSEEHGRTLFSENMLDVICASERKLNRLSGRFSEKETGKVKFCFWSSGPFRFLAIMYRIIYRKIFRKKHVL